MTVTNKYPAELYAEQVRSGGILVCEYVCLAVGRYYTDLDRAFDKGRYFDKKTAMHAIRFIEKFKHTKGEWAGQRFRLEPWQQFVLWNIFGWKNADGTRRFIRLYRDRPQERQNRTVCGRRIVYALRRRRESPGGLFGRDGQGSGEDMLF